MCKLSRRLAPHAPTRPHPHPLTRPSPTPPFYFEASSDWGPVISDSFCAGESQICDLHNTASKVITPCKVLTKPRRCKKSRGTYIRTYVHGQWSSMGYAANMQSQWGNERCGVDPDRNSPSSETQGSLRSRRDWLRARISRVQRKWILKGVARIYWAVDSSDWRFVREFLPAVLGAEIGPVFQNVSKPLTSSFHSPWDTSRFFIYEGHKFRRVINFALLLLYVHGSEMA